MWILTPRKSHAHFKRREEKRGEEKKGENCYYYTCWVSASHFFSGITRARRLRSLSLILLRQQTFFGAVVVRRPELSLVGHTVSKQAKRLDACERAERASMYAYKK
jgi:hypothetical protein